MLISITIIPYKTAFVNGFCLVNYRHKNRVTDQWYPLLALILYTNYS